MYTVCMRVCVCFNVREREHRASSDGKAELYHGCVCGGLCADVFKFKQESQNGVSDPTHTHTHTESKCPSRHPCVPCGCVYVPITLCCVCVCVCVDVCPSHRSLVGCVSTWFTLRSQGGRLCYSLLRTSWTRTKCLRQCSSTTEG